MSTELNTILKTIKEEEIHQAQHNSKEVSSHIVSMGYSTGQWPCA